MTESPIQDNEILIFDLFIMSSSVVVPKYLHIEHILFYLLPVKDRELY